MSNTNTGGPAFPGLHPSKECQYNDPGMTLRDYFAARALQNFRDQIGSQSDQEWFDLMAEGAYRLANAMMKARTA
ncbi:MAG: hypothetical protein ACOYL0_14105 [Limnohabitans sp.]